MASRAVSLHRPITEARRRLSTVPAMNVFNRRAKQQHRDRLGRRRDVEQYEYLRHELAERLADRVPDILKKFNRALDLGCGRGYLSTHLDAEDVAHLTQIDMSAVLLENRLPSNIPHTESIHMDEEHVNFENDRFDLVISSGSLHWVNDLPGVFRKVHDILVPDGVFLGSLLGGHTLFELRSSLQLAETEVQGGFGPHVSPMIDMPDLGRLLGAANFRMVTIDIDEIKIRYPSINELMHDLSAMAEGNCAWKSKPTLTRKTIERAGEMYMSEYGDGASVPATFHAVNFIAWKPHPSQAQPRPRGSARRSLKQLGVEERSD